MNTLKGQELFLILSNCFHLLQPGASKRRHVFSVMEGLIWVLFVPVILVLPEGTGAGDVEVLQHRASHQFIIQWLKAANGSAEWLRQLVLAPPSKPLLDEKFWSE